MIFGLLQSSLLVVDPWIPIVGRADGNKWVGRKCFLVNISLDIERIQAALLSNRSLGCDMQSSQNLSIHRSSNRQQKDVGDQGGLGCRCIQRHTW